MKETLSTAQEAQASELAKAATAAAGSVPSAVPLFGRPLQAVGDGAQAFFPPQALRLQRRPTARRARAIPLHNHRTAQVRDGFLAVAARGSGIFPNFCPSFPGSAWECLPGGSASHRQPARPALPTARARGGASS
jgi:hypothetical protein